MTQLFYAYATADARQRDQLEKHLRVLKQRGVLSKWDAREVGPGSRWRSEVSPQVKQADVVLLLMSSDLVSSDYVNSPEVTFALERHRRGETRVIPVLLRPVNLKSTPVAALPSLPRDGKPVTRWSNSDAAFQAIMNGIAPAGSANASASATTVAAANEDGAADASALASNNGAVTAPAAGDSDAQPSAPAAVAASSSIPAAPKAAPNPAQIVLQIAELGSDFVPVEQPGDRDEATAADSKFVSLAKAGSRRVAQLVYKTASPRDAVARLEAAVRAEISKGGSAETLMIGWGQGESVRRVTTAGKSTANISLYAAKSAYLVAAKVMGDSGRDAPALEPTAVAENVVRRMLARIPS